MQRTSEEESSGGGEGRRAQELALQEGRLLADSLWAN